MIYMKHSEFGNGHFEDEEQGKLESQGWIRWPRTGNQKAGIVETVTEVITREQLESTAEAIGLKVDGRWSDARLIKEIEKLQ